MDAVHFRIKLPFVCPPTAQLKKVRISRILQFAFGNRFVFRFAFFAYQALLSPIFATFSLHSFWLKNAERRRSWWCLVSSLSSIPSVLSSIFGYFLWSISHSFPFLLFLLLVFLYFFLLSFSLSTQLPFTDLVVARSFFLLFWLSLLVLPSSGPICLYLSHFRSTKNHSASSLDHHCGVDFINRITS